MIGGMTYFKDTQAYGAVQSSCAMFGVGMTHCAGTHRDPALCPQDR